MYATSRLRRSEGSRSRRNRSSSMPSASSPVFPPGMARRTSRGRSAEYGTGAGGCMADPLPVQGDGAGTDAGRGREEQDPGAGQECAGLLRLRHGDRQAARADVPEPIDVDPQLRKPFRRDAQVPDHLVDEAPARLMTEHDVEVAVGPPRPLHHGVHRRDHDGGGGHGEVSPVTEERCVEATSTARAQYLGSEPPPGGVAPLRGIAPEVARAEAALRILAGLDDERAPAVT